MKVRAFAKASERVSEGTPVQRRVNLRRIRT